MSQLLKEFDKGDEFGIDPLLDTNLNNALGITKYFEFVVVDQEAGRPDLISYHLYGNTIFWREIMAFNGITDVRQIQIGTVLRAPDRAQLLATLNSSFAKNSGREVKI